MTGRAIVLCGLLIAGAVQAQPPALLPAPAQSLPDRDHRTVKWYADNPAFLAKMRAACRNDPGRAARDADCVNSHYAEMEVLTRSQGAGPSPFDTTPPTSPKYWQDRPAMRAQQLAQCAMIKSEAERAAFFCGPAGYH
jgi:hypothetical protein